MPEPKERRDMASEYRMRKFAREFETLDVDKDGFVSKADFERIAGNLTAALGLESGSRFDAIHARYKFWWEAVAVRDKDGDGRVNLSEWLEHDEEITSSTERYQQVLEVGADEIFRMLDFDEDGVISLAEYTAWIGSYGVSDTAAKEAFAHLDTQGEGRISQTDTRKLVREYYQADDPAAPGNWLFGGLS